MRILTEPTKLADLKLLSPKMFGNLVKGVVDVKRELVAIDGELHSDLAEMLVENGSSGANLWGFDLYPEQTDADWLEFDSMINIKPLIGNRSRTIDDSAVKERAEYVIKKFIAP